MLRRIAAIDIHKKVLMVVVVKVIGEAKDAIGQALKFECIRFGTPASERARLVEWLKQQGVTEVVMESTAQYWKPIWMDLEPHFAKLHLVGIPGQAEQHSGLKANRIPGGSRTLFGLPRNSVRLGPGMISTGRRRWTSSPVSDPSRGRAYCQPGESPCVRSRKS